ncbi:putative beta-lysine N-acetyltransferase [Draconibacterium halophilum]|uniref:Putative beta-lysine N-acetyltransferase n=1 Tax=Draconibacterium halophilum TaxID=2706887 RepID=A0A6C0RHG9_9BACT|nr:putative beta-lysine N-acetyltransferase [Draconibacterium halophilum]QIA08973.1 putative beta-lysine N-acetyltransferase [Draconibacterium halophilum]
MQDKIEKLGNGSIIQHGQLNDRVYLMKLDSTDCPSTILEEINNLARKNKYSKIICKIPDHAAPVFLSGGFLPEAQIPAFYNDSVAAFFVSKFLNSDRLLDIETDQLNDLSEMLKTQDSITPRNGKNNADITVRKLEKEDYEQITDIYREVFVTYPFPIYNPGYILKTFQNGTQYFGAESGGKLIALASAEVDEEGKNAEMTDFATLPNQRGKNLSVLLLNTLEKSMKKQGINTLYTMARLNSVGMTRTFLKMDYCYSGTLIKNTHIAGKIESMNILYKHI